MRTTKCAVIIGGCIGFLIFSILFLEWLFLSFILPLLFLIFFSIILFQSKEIDIEIERSLSNVKIFQNDKIEIDIKLTNKGEKIHFLEIYDTLPGKVAISKGNNYAVIDLKKDEEINLKYEIECPMRGHYLIGPLLLRTRDFLGMFYKEGIVETESYVTVIPPIEEIKDISVRAKANIYPGIMMAKHAGIGTEFFGIRQYSSGDTFKKINWKSFARFNKPMVNEYELESTTDVIIIVDSRGIQGVGTLKENPLEYNIKAAASVASHFLKRRDRVGLIGYGPSQGRLFWVYPESGKKQLYKIIEELVGLQAFGDFNFNSAIYSSITHMLPKKALIVFVSSLEGDMSIPIGLERLTAHGFRVIVISPSPVDLEFSLHEINENIKLAYRILKFERDNYLSRLRNTGAKIVDWNPTLPLSVSLKEVEKYQTRR